MEYVFGTVFRGGVEVENLKTVGEEHTDLTGFQSVIRKYPDQTITDNFKVVEKYNSSKDDEGNCYDWYVISNHNTIIDKSEAIKNDYQAKIDFLAIMSDIEFPEDDKEGLA